MGAAVDESNALCVEGSRQPAWTSAQSTYLVKGNWLDKLFQACRLTLSFCEEYLYNWRDGLARKKQNLDLRKSISLSRMLKRELKFFALTLLCTSLSEKFLKQWLGLQAPRHHACVTLFWLYTLRNMSAVCYRVVVGTMV